MRSIRANDTWTKTPRPRDLEPQSVRLDEATRRGIAERLKAVKRGVHAGAVAANGEMLRRELFANAFLRAYLNKHPIGRAQLKEEYDRRKAMLAGCREYSVRQIVVYEEVHARKVVEELARGADFDRLLEAIERGDSKNYGGPLGWISIDDFDRVVVAAVAALKPGAFTREPVRARFGWRVLLLDAVRDIRIPSFEADKERLLRILEQRRIEQLRRELHAAANGRLPSAVHPAVARSR